ncbi:MAG: hypothetical protein KA716_20760 [Gloeotrichia echinulata DEX184]|nr:hypothetical protein [Gloeotrichia echinulata DEX184]
MKKSLLIVIGFLTFIVCTTLTIQLSKAAPAVNEWSDYTTATAAAYCLAKHPYRTTYTGPYTPDGYEIAAAPGIVGAVRRNFVFNRTSTLTDQGNGQTCAQGLWGIWKTLRCFLNREITYPKGGYNNIRKWYRRHCCISSQRQ